MQASRCKFCSKHSLMKRAVLTMWRHYVLSCKEWRRSDKSINRNKQFCREAEGHVSETWTWPRRPEMSQTWEPERSLHFKYQSIMEQHNGILFTQYTQTLNSYSPRLFIENHFFCQQKSRPVFYHLAPIPLSLKCHSDVKQRLSNVSLRIPCK
jgi:hypothetical protein